jgi:formylglycine-generating enzyme required for sulfatase activity
LTGHANLAERSARRADSTLLRCEDWLDDGWCFTAPIGSFEPNEFGVHDAHGNVAEWCSDGRRVPPSALAIPVRAGASRERAFRGGSFKLPAAHARIDFGDYADERTAESSFGVRPARPLEH